MTKQQGDIDLFQSINDGEIIVTDGMVQMSGGLGTAAYLSLFGGNDDDSGKTNLQFWGNVIENTDSKKYISETQYLLNKLPAVSGNLLRIQNAVKRDLEWFITEKIANGIEVTVSIPGLNKINISIKIMAYGTEESFNFTENWKASS